MIFLVRSRRLLLLFLLLLFGRLGFDLHDLHFHHNPASRSLAIVHVSTRRCVRQSRRYTKHSFLALFEPNNSIAETTNKVFTRANPTIYIAIKPRYKRIANIPTTHFTLVTSAGDRTCLKGVLIRSSPGLSSISPTSHMEK
jgi:hypothetical protein